MSYGTVCTRWTLFTSHDGVPTSYRFPNTHTVSQSHGLKKEDELPTTEIKTSDKYVLSIN